MRTPRDHFDLVARWYDRFIGPSEDQVLLGLLHPSPGDWLLDVGGGTGRASTGLLSGTGRVVVCDRSWGMLVQARNKGMNAVMASADRLPFRRESAGGVLVVDAFHHFNVPSPAVAQPAAALELVRVLTPGGRLVIMEPDIRQTPARVIAFLERAAGMRSRILRPDAVAALVSAAGGGRPEIRCSGISVQMSFTRPTCPPRPEP